LSKLNRPTPGELDALVELADEIFLKRLHFSRNTKAEMLNLDLLGEAICLMKNAAHNEKLPQERSCQG
jgi:hypothetical protein